MTNIEKYDKVFVRVLNVEQGELNENFTMSSIRQWDSVAHISLISELEDAFDILLESEDILNYGSYENGKLIMKKYGVVI